MRHRVTDVNGRDAKAVLKVTAMQKMLVMLGTRPEAIKLTPVIAALRKQADSFATTVCVVAQHREMLDQVLNLFEIRSDHDLDLMRPHQDPLQVMQLALEKLKNVYEMERPDGIIVQGDTTTAMIATLVAYHLKIKAIHIEAGLRTGEKSSPFPEEVNRRLIAVLADLHFAPTPLAQENLLREGIPSSQIFVTGNTAIDALFMAVERLKSSKILFQVHQELKTLGIEPGRNLVLVTAHRRESFGDGLREICQALATLAVKYPRLQFVYPVHRNPQVLEPVRYHLGHFSNILLTEPLSYLHCVALMQRSLLILTDSGGIQEEAPSLGKKVLVMRDHTERREGLQAGCSVLVGRSAPAIVRAFEAAFHHLKDYQPPPNPYGNGQAANLIVEILKTQGMSFERSRMRIGAMA